MDVVDLAAALVPAWRIHRHVRKPADAPPESDLSIRDLEVERDVPHGGDAIAMQGGAVIEARHPHTILAQTLQIEIGAGVLRVIGKALGLGEHLAVLVDQTLSIPGEIGCRLPEAGSGIDIGRDALGRLAAAKQPPVFGLPNCHVAGRLVHEHCGAG